MISPAALLLGTASGLVVGSFVTTAALRATTGEQALLGRSHCDGCGVSLGLAQTWPVVSFVVRKGACASCGARIDPLHPIGELAGAAIGAAAVAAPPSLETLLTTALGFTLLASAVFDAKTRRLPDSLTLVAALLCVALACCAGGTAVFAGAVASAVAFALLSAMRLARAAGGRDPGLGFGDVKLICALAIWLGLRTPWMVCAAAVMGLVAWAVLRPADGKLAFGPMIALAALGLGLVMEDGWWPATI